MVEKLKLTSLLSTSSKLAEALSADMHIDVFLFGHADNWQGKEVNQGDEKVKQGAKRILPLSKLPLAWGELLQVRMEDEEVRKEMTSLPGGKDSIHSSGGLGRA